MGLAASQCRLLVLTQRKSDLEYRAQNITNRKLLLSGQTQNIATNYSDKLNNYITEFTFDIDKNGNAQTLNETLTVDSIYAVNSNLIGTYRLRLADGRIAVSDASQLPYAIASSRGRSVATAAELYSNLTNSEKLAYMKESISGIVSAANNGALPESLQSIMNQKVLKADKDGFKEGNLVSTRRNELTSLLTEIYAKAGITALTEVDEKSGKTSINQFTSYTSVDNLTDKQLTALKNLSTMSSLPADVSDKWLSYYKKFDGNESAASVPALNENLNDSSLSAEAKRHNKESIAAFVYALNEYIMEHPTTSGTSDSFLNASVLADKDYTEIASNVSDNDTMTVLEYLQAKQTITKEATSATDITEAETAICELMNGLGSSIVDVLQAYSSFGAYVQAQTQGTDFADCQPISDNEIYCASTGETYIILPGLKNYKNLQNSLQTGALYLEQRNAENTGWDSVLIGGNSVIKDRLYTEDDQAAEAEYETQTAIIQRQDKMLDVELKQIETQQKACDNEIDSVKKILDKNVERSFKVFS